MIAYPFKLETVVSVHLPTAWFDDPNGPEGLDGDYWYLDQHHPGAKDFCQFYLYLFNERDFDHRVDDEGWEAHVAEAIEKGATSKLIQLLHSCRETGAAWAILDAG